MGVCVLRGTVICSSGDYKVNYVTVHSLYICSNLAQSSSLSVAPINTAFGLCNKNQLDALFILSLFRQSTSTYFGHVCHQEVYYIYIYIYIYTYTYIHTHTHKTIGTLFHYPTLMHNSLFINNMFVTLLTSTCFEH